MKSATVPPPSDGAGYVPAEPAKADVGKPTIVGGLAFGLAPLANRLQALYRGWATRGRARRWPDHLYDLMDEDPVCGGSLDILVNGCLANRAQVVPRHRPRPGRPADDPAKSDQSRRIADLCTYGLERLDTPFHEVLARLTRSAWKHGAALADLVWDKVPRGEFQGLWVLKEVRELHRRDWDFAVDEFLRVGGYFGRGGDGQYKLWGRQKFLALTWGGEGGDPRGRSLYDRAADAWNFADQMPAEWFKFAMRHGQPVPDLMLPEDAQPTVDPATGLIEQPEAQAARVLANYAAGKHMIRPFGSAFNLNEPKAEGQVFRLIEEYTRRQKVLAILLQARATMEAQNGSKADSETSERILDTFNFFARQWISRAVEWSPLYLHGLYNFGPAGADEHTPSYEMGDSGQQQDFAAILAALGGAGLELIPAVWPDLYAKYKLGEVSIEEVSEYVDGKAEAAVKPPGDPNADQGKAAGPPKKGAA